MGSFSNYTENKVLDHITGKATFAEVTNCYIVLSTADPLDDASGLAEPSGNNYARKLTSDTDWGSASGGSITNSGGAITFNQASGSWGTITHFALYDNSTGGNMLAHGQLTASKAIASGDTLQFPTSSLTITLD